MGKEMAYSADSYVDPLNDMSSRYSLMARSSKDLDSEQMDYDGLLDGISPSFRDQEYVQHSSLWGHHYVGVGDGGIAKVDQPQHSAQVKTESTLPAYCNPPNPCPVGFTEDQGCQLDFENTAAFSRDFQSAQECMCDSEHMFDCNVKETDEGSMKSDLTSLIEKQLHNSEHKNLVAKKFQPNQVLNQNYRINIKL